MKTVAKRKRKIGRAVGLRRWIIACYITVAILRGRSFTMFAYCILTDGYLLRVRSSFLLKAVKIRPALLGNVQHWCVWANRTACLGMQLVSKSRSCTREYHIQKLVVSQVGVTLTSRAIIAPQPFQILETE